MTIERRSICLTMKTEFICMAKCGAVLEHLHTIPLADQDAHEGLQRRKVHDLDDFSSC